MRPGVNSGIGDGLAGFQQLGVGLGLAQAQIGEDLLVVEHAPGLEVNGEAVDPAVGGNVTQVAGGQTQTVDHFVVGHVGNIALLHQIGIQAGVTHHNLRLIAGGQRGLQLGEVVCALVVHHVVPGDVVLRMLGGKGGLNRVQAGLLGGLSHIVENRNLYVLGTLGRGSPSGCGSV